MRERDSLVRLCCEAQGVLKRILGEAGAAAQGGLWDTSPSRGVSGFAGLDRVLEGAKLPAGITVELVGEDAAVLGVAAHWTAHAQGAQHFAALLDPFDEVAGASIRGLDPRRTLVVDTPDPHHLAAAAVPLLQRRAIEALLIPPGVLRQGHLSDRPRRRLRHSGDELRAFHRALEGLCWIGRRRGVAVLLARGRHTANSFDVLGLSHLRLRIQGSGRACCAIIEHNSLAPATCGETVRLFASENEKTPLVC